LKIAIDATAIPTGTKKGGVSSYILSLISELEKFDYVNEYYIFIKKEDLAFFRLETDNFKFIQCNVNSKLIRLIWEQLILPRYIKKYKIDLIHSPHYTIPIMLNQCKKVVTFHDMTFFLFPEMHIYYKRIIFKKMIPTSAAKADLIISVSDNTAKDIHALLNISKEKLRVIPLGVNSKFRVIRNVQLLNDVKRKYKTSDKFIFYLGTLEPRKNIHNLIRAYHLAINNEKIGHKLVIAGEKGWDYKKLFKLVDDLQINDQVIFIGFVSENELPLLYNAADLFVYPSIYEGFGIPVLEAMSCGVPVISSSVSSLPEIVKNAGLLVEPNNIERLSQAICEVIINRDLNQKLSKLGLKRASQYSWEKTAKETLRVYEDVFYNDN